MRTREQKHNDWFHFKQFRVVQRHAGMRVTTHACVFAAWLPLDAASPCRRALDIGAGTGLLSLMLAQRCQADIDAVELDAGALIDLQENFSASPWSARLHAHAGRIQDFSPAHGQTYDLILSNPPFFRASLRNDDPQRTLARHDDALDFADLAAAVQRLLAPAGRFAVLVPQEAAARLQAAMQSAGFSCVRDCHVRSLAHKPVTRRMQIWQRAAATAGDEPGPGQLTQNQLTQNPASETPASQNPLPPAETLQVFGDYPAYSASCLALLQPYYLSL